MWTFLPETELSVDELSTHASPWGFTDQSDPSGKVTITFYLLYFFPAIFGHLSLTVSSLRGDNVEQSVF